MSSHDNERLFRKVALQRLASPDRVDALLGLHRPRTPWILAGTAIAALAALYWGIAGRVEHKVTGRCILISPKGVAEISAAAAGRVANLNVRIGDQIAAGQEIGRIVRVDLFEQIEQAVARLAELERRQKEVAAYGALAGSQTRKAGTAESASIDEQVRLAAERAKAFEQRLEVERGLAAQGLITRQTTLDTEQGLAGQILERERLRDRAKQLALQSAEEDRQRIRERVSIEFQVNEARRSLEALRDMERQTAPVKSPYAGRVIEVKAHNGLSVGYGAEILQLERSAEDGASIEAAVYLPGGEGKLVAAGMPVEIIPDYVKRQEFGFLRAKVLQVSEYPASIPGMRPLVQNDNLLKELSGTRAPIFVRASLDQGANGSFVWSAAAFKPPAVRSGALCQAEVTVGTRRPIEMLMPALRRWLGLA